MIRDFLFYSHDHSVALVSGVLLYPFFVYTTSYAYSLNGKDSAQVRRPREQCCKREIQYMEAAAASKQPWIV
jgi:hypothetical protein